MEKPLIKIYSLVTLELQQTGNLLFLDVEIIRNNMLYKIDWTDYRRLVGSNNTMFYNSNVPYKYIAEDLRFYIKREIEPRRCLEHGINKKIIFPLLYRTS